MSFIERVPQNVCDVNGRDDEKQWRRAMEREIDSMKKNNTWTEITLPKTGEILKTRWVFASKPLEREIEDQYKARLVVKGCGQRKSFDYDNIYSPVAKMPTIRTLLSVGNQYNYVFKQLDVKTAFLNGELKEDIYIYPPEGVDCDTGHVLKLNKSIYGLKQASRCWNDKINSFLVNIGFRRSDNDYCLYSKIYDNNLIFLLLYVDDIILTGANEEYVEICKRDLMKEFDLKDKGNLKHFLD